MVKNKNKNKNILVSGSKFVLFKSSKVRTKCASLEDTLIDNNYYQWFLQATGVTVDAEEVTGDDLKCN